MVITEGSGTAFNRFRNQCGRARGIAEREPDSKDAKTLEDFSEMGSLNVKGNSIRYAHQSSEELAILASRIASENNYVFLGKNARESFNAEQKAIYSEYCSILDEIKRRDEALGEGFNVDDYLDF